MLARGERGLDRREPLDLAALARRVLRAPRPEVRRSCLTFVTKLVPSSTIGDEILIEQLIANLIDNATHYNHAGGHVEVRTDTDTDHSRLSVANTGPIIAPHELEHLSEPFHRLHRQGLARSDGRHRLGLSIVRTIAAAHGAPISLRARTEGGLEVTVTFARGGTGSDSETLRS
jgi:signal transduction histidine kinase